MSSVDLTKRIELSRTRTHWLYVIGKHNTSCIFPNTTTIVREKINGFREKSNFPNVVGAIDGTHIYIRAPKVNHEDYFDFKRRYSFVVQGVVDASGSYLSVSTGFPGSMHDARVLRLSNLFPLAEGGEENFDHALHGIKRNTSSAPDFR